MKTNRGARSALGIKGSWALSAIIVVLFSGAALAEELESPSPTASWSPEQSDAQKKCYTDNGAEAPEAGKVTSKFPTMEGLAKIHECLNANGWVPPPQPTPRPRQPKS